MQLRGVLCRDVGVSAPLSRAGHDACGTEPMQRDGNGEVPRTTGYRPVRRGTSGSYPVCPDCSRSLRRHVTAARTHSMHSDADPGALSQVFTRKRPGALSSNTVTGSWTSRRYNGQETVMTDRRKRITSFPLPFYHGYRKRYKCVKLPSWDTARGTRGQLFAVVCTARA